MPNLIQRAFCLLLLTAVLSGCVQPRSTITATNLRDQAIEEIGSVGGIFDEESGPDVATADDPFVARLNQAQTAYESKFLNEDGTVPASGKTVATGANLKVYVAGRFTQVNDLCKIYFDGLVKRDQTNELYKSVTSLASNVASGVLGLTGAAAFQLSVLALSEAAALGTLETYEEIYLLGPSPEAIYSAVRDAQKTFRTANKAKIDVPSHYPMARNLVRDYAAICTPERIRTMITKKLEDDDRPGRAALAAVTESAFVTIIGKNTLGESLDQQQAADVIVALGVIGTPAQVSDADKRMAAQIPNWATLRANRSKEIAVLVDTLKTLRETGAAPGLFALAEERKELGAS